MGFALRTAVSVSFMGAFFGSRIEYAPYYAPRCPQLPEIFAGVDHQRHPAIGSLQQNAGVVRVRLEQLGHLNAILERKRKIGEKYLEVIRQNSGLETYFKQPKIDTFGAFAVVSQKPLEHIQKYFNSLQIDTARTIPYGPLHDNLGLSPLDFPNTTRLFERGLLLPVYASLGRISIERIMASIKGYY